MKNTATILIAILGLLGFGWAAADDHGVERAQFTTAIEDREPTDDIAELDTDHDRIIFFTEYRDMEGETLTHRWMYDGEEQATVASEVGGPRWRTWSSKRLLADWAGTWTVEIVDGEGNVLDEQSFVYGEAEEDDADDTEEEGESEEEEENEER